MFGPIGIFFLVFLQVPYMAEIKFDGFAWFVL